MAFEDICVACGEPFKNEEQGALIRFNSSGFNKGNVASWVHMGCLKEYDENNYVQLKLFR